jgi:hypothetical protein
MPGASARCVFVLVCVHMYATSYICQLHCAKNAPVNSQHWRASVYHRVLFAVPTHDQVLRRGGHSTHADRVGQASARQAQAEAVVCHLTFPFFFSSEQNFNVTLRRGFLSWCQQTKEKTTCTKTKADIIGLRPLLTRHEDAGNLQQQLRLARQRVKLNLFAVPQNKVHAKLLQLRRLLAVATEQTQSRVC